MLRMLPGFLMLMLPVAVIGLLGAGALPAAAQEWAINKQKSKLIFEGEAGGQTVIGEFQQFEAEIHFDPEHLDSTEIAASIDINTISTGQSQLDDALRSKDWFDAQTYPTAGFRANAIKPGNGEGHYILDGVLAIKGKTRPVLLPFTLAVDLGEATVTGETIVNRLDFGLGPNGPVSGTVVGDQIKVRLALFATRLDN